MPSPRLTFGETEIRTCAKEGSEQERCEIVRGLHQPKTATAD